MNLGSSDLGIFIHKTGKPLPGVISVVPLHLKLTLPFSNFGVLMLMTLWAKKDSIVLAMANHSKRPGRLGLY